MHTAGKPVDPVTIAREAARRAIMVKPSDMEGGMASAVTAEASDVWQYQALARIAQTGRETGTDAADPRMQTAVLLRHIGLRLQGLEREAGLQPGRAWRNGAEPCSAAGGRWLQTRHGIAGPERT